nr:MAG TPA: hypothetical protein [Caudoviricetes sp.]
MCNSQGTLSSTETYSLKSLFYCNQRKSADLSQGKVIKTC